MHHTVVNDVVYPDRRRKHQGYARSRLIKITAFSCPIKHNNIIRYYHLSHCRLKNKNGRILNWLSRYVLPVSIKVSNGRDQPPVSAGCYGRPNNVEDFEPLPLTERTTSVVSTADDDRRVVVVVVHIRP